MEPDDREEERIAGFGGLERDLTNEGLPLRQGAEVVANLSKKRFSELLGRRERVESRT